MHRLFYSPGACSLGIHVLLEEIGAPYEAVRVNLREGEQFKPEFQAVNPKSKVPALVREDGYILARFPPLPDGRSRQVPGGGFGAAVALRSRLTQGCQPLPRQSLRP